MGRRRARTRRVGYAARRALIVDAALEVFAERGYHAASLDEIARRAGITKPVLYDHFASKEALHLHLLERQRAEAAAAVLAGLDAAGESAERQRLAAGIDAYLAWIGAHPYAWRMLPSEGAAIVGAVLGNAGPRAPMLAELVGGAVNGLVRWWHDHRDVPAHELRELIVDVLGPGLERVMHARDEVGANAS